MLVLDAQNRDRLQNRSSLGICDSYRRTNVADLAMEIVGGSAFYRQHGLEKLFRDVQGVRYHPLCEKA
ncbi:acyl-CoA dehydrogenase family protein [Gloeocapsa sp. BRSZ]